MGGRGSYSATRRGTGTVRTSSGRTGQRTPHPMDVGKFQGMTLQQVEDRIRGLSHEELFVIGKDGKILAAYNGNSDSVAFSMNELLRDGASKKLSAASRRQVYTGVLDRYWAKTLPSYGFDYVTRNKAYNYNR